MCVYVNYIYAASDVCVVYLQYGLVLLDPKIRLKGMLHKFICRMCDDDEEGLNARAQGSTLQSLFVAPPPASI